MLFPHYCWAKKKPKYLSNNKAYWANRIPNPKQ